MYRIASTMQKILITLTSHKVQSFSGGIFIDSWDLWTRDAREMASWTDWCTHYGRRLPFRRKKGWDREGHYVIWKAFAVIQIMSTLRCGTYILIEICYCERDGCARHTAWYRVTKVHSSDLDRQTRVGWSSSQQLRNMYVCACGWLVNLLQINDAFYVFVQLGSL